MRWLITLSLLALTTCQTPHQTQPTEDLTKTGQAHNDPTPTGQNPTSTDPTQALSPLGASYNDAATRIIAHTQANSRAYDKLETLCLEVGHRLSGSPSLDRAIQWATDALKADGHDNVHAEPVQVPKWVRGDESLTMLTPRSASLRMLGLGGSVGTPKAGITAQLLIARDEAELDALGDNVKGRIVLFNNPMPPYDPEHGTAYGPTVRFRVHGARLAAERGAVAVLVRSVTAVSLYTPHTGMLNYGDAQIRIPAAAITTEDADLLARLAVRNHPITLTLKMDAQDQGLAPSANVLGELLGSEKPQEIVVIGGHIDSWDVGQGAHDDGAGCVMAMEALTMLRQLNLRPRRTIRVVLWTNEENGLAGAHAYAAAHATGQDAEFHFAAIESDSGGFAPFAFGVQLQDTARQDRAVETLRGLLPLFKDLGVQKIEPGFSGADIGPLQPAGIPTLGFMTDPAHYFDIHHTDADTFDKINKTDLDRSTAALALLAYLLADMPTPLAP